MECSGKQPNFCYGYAFEKELAISCNIRYENSPATVDTTVPTRALLFIPVYC
jgi:hypothetical protein